MGGATAFGANLPLKRLFSCEILVLMLFLAMLSSAVPPAHAGPAYGAGVTVGQWASYAPVNVTYHGTSSYAPVPQQIMDLNATAQLTATIKQFYSSTNVTVQSVAEYKNFTTKTEILNGDLMNGAGNLTFGLIAGGLSSGDHLWAGPYALYTPVINWTVSMTYLGVSRTVNIYNTTYSTPFGHSNIVHSLEYVWDQTSGIALQSTLLNLYPDTTTDGGYVEYTDVKVQSTNIFSNPNSPGFTVASSSPASVTSSTSTTSTITVTAIKGFSETVTLTDTVPSGLTCNPISPGTLPGYGTATLSCSSTIPGTYNVTITATSGPTTHTTTTTMTVTAAPTILGLASIAFYAIIGIVILIMAATGAYLVLKSKSEPQEETTTTTTTT